MDLKTYFSGLSVDERDAFASRCKTSSAHIRNVGYGHRTCGEKLAVLVERESDGVVTRRDLLPGDWHLIWPEIVTDEFPAPSDKKAAWHMTPLASLRKKRGLTLQALADAIGSNTGNLSRIEHGQVPHKTLTDKIVTYFGGAISERQLLQPTENQA